MRGFFIEILKTSFPSQTSKVSLTDKVQRERSWTCLSRCINSLFHRGEKGWPIGISFSLATWEELQEDFYFSSTKNESKDIFS